MSADSRYGGSNATAPTCPTLALLRPIELTVAKPLVNLRLLRWPNFSIGVLANMLVGFALFGTVYILPQHLG
jgi:DHA2 family multidrug resistance protein